MKTGKGAQDAKYARVTEALRADLRQAVYLPGDRMPSENELVTRFGVSVITARRAYSEMAAAGEVIRIKGKGTFAAQAATADGRQAPPVRLVTFVLLDYLEADEAMMQIILGAQSHLSARGYQMTIQGSNNSEAMEKAILENCCEAPISGVLLFSTNPDESVQNARHLEACGVPLVFIDRSPAGIPASVIASNNYDGAYQVAQHLLEMGHRKILFLGDRQHINTEVERLRGFTACLSSSGRFEPGLCLFDSFRRLDEILALIREQGATAACCVNDKLAVWLLNSLRGQKVAVPGEVSVTGFDDISLSRSAQPALTTVRQDFTRMGASAADALLEQINNPRRRGHLSVGIPMELVRRDTVKDLRAPEGGMEEGIA